MTNDEDVSVLAKSELLALSNLYHEQNSIQRISTIVKEDIIGLQKEIKKLELEKRWCFDADGLRVRPTPEEESERISQQTTHNPECKNDVILALKKKKTWLQMEVSELEEKLKKARRKHVSEKT